MAVTIQNLAIAVGRAAPEQGSDTAQQWEMWIDDALMFIEARRLELDRPAPDQAKIDYVVREAVAAHIKRPDDATQVTISIDDGSTSKSYKSGRGRVAILDEWWRLLGLQEDSGAFSIDMLPTGYSPHLAWCAVHFGGNYCSCGTDIAGFPIFESG